MSGFFQTRKSQRKNFKRKKRGEKKNVKWKTNAEIKKERITALAGK
jgi:hypothetical protein